MRRLARRLFTLCSVLSLLLCVAALVLAVDAIVLGNARQLRRSEFGLASRGGRVSLVLGDIGATSRPGVVFEDFSAPGFYARRITSPTRQFFGVAAWWCLLVVGLPVPLAWAVAWARRGRPPGLCSTCGYDLRASPGRCPECGTEPVPKETT